jgi:P27 family predicted phage terminase small subunit
MGNPSRRPINDREPVLPSPDTSFDDPPALVALFPKAAAYWREVAPMLRASRQITEGDRATLIALCIEWGKYLDAMEQSLSVGLLFRTPSGYPMPNPYYPVATSALKACIKLWPELGLTPSSRARLQTPDDQAVDPFAEFDIPSPLSDTAKH